VYKDVAVVVSGQEAVAAAFVPEFDGAGFSFGGHGGAPSSARGNGSRQPATSILPMVMRELIDVHGDQVSQTRKPKAAQMIAIIM
jgi:hypothetical protein